MFLIEFGKIFRRNFNYLFGLIVLLISTACIYILKHYQRTMKCLKLIQCLILY